MNKLLILGATYHEILIVESARKLGYYTIVTDNHTDWDLAPAKMVADEAWNVSWSEIDTLESKCREVGVSGVIAGFSEFRVENMIKLTGRLDLPCWLSMEQLDVTRDKVKFKRLCADYGIPCVHEYTKDDAKTYPVIIKPVDRAGSIGINVAYNDEEFAAYYETAMSLSPSRHVIIEDFISDGVKFDVYYLIHKGEIRLIGTNDTIMCDQRKGIEILQKVWTFPSEYEDLYRKEVDAKVCKMLEGIGLHDGYVTMSAFYMNGCFYFFEAGFRLSGELSFNYYKSESGFDYLDYLVLYAMGDASDVQIPDDVSHKGKCIVLNFFGKDGNVSHIEGLSNVKSIPEVISLMLFVKEGDTVSNSSKVLKKIAMCTLYSEDEKNLLEKVQKVNQEFDIIDESGKSMIYEKWMN